MASKRQVGVSELAQAMKLKRFAVLTVARNTLQRRPKDLLTDRSPRPSANIEQKACPLPVLRPVKSPLRLCKLQQRLARVLPRASIHLSSLDFSASPIHFSKPQLTHSPKPSFPLLTVHPIMRRLRSQVLNTSHSSDSQSSRDLIAPLSPQEDSPVSSLAHRLQDRRVSEAGVRMKKGLYGA